jgi:excinuclease ABC subunit C
MAIQNLRDEIAKLPEQPGVYLYFNCDGDTIYVGKARVLRDRVRSYLSAHGKHAKTNALLKEVARLEVIVTDSVAEALALENNLIKQRRPRYNILLRDDKNYPYLQLSMAEDFPRVLVAREVKRDGNYYAGPFMPTRLARKTMALTHRLFGIRSCNEVITGRRDRPCLEYDIKRCVAPCVSEICSQEQYKEAVDQTRLFLEGRTDEVVGRLRTQMQDASDEEFYERAAHYRDAIRTVEMLQNRQQKMATTQLNNRDAFGIKLGSQGTVVQVFQVRNGRVVERIELVADEVAMATEQESDIVQTAVQQFYSVHEVPAEVHVPVDVNLHDREAIETFLTSRAGRRVKVFQPKRGGKRGLLDLAIRNAELSYGSRYSEETSVDLAALEELQTVLALPILPHRVECFDISTIQGRDTVGSMVVCDDGRMRRSEYRKYRVRGLEFVEQKLSDRSIRGGIERDAVGEGEGGAPKPDDFAAMEEVVFRRYRRLLDEGGPFPDLVVIDGGKGQLTAAYRAFEKLGLANLVAVGIAKKQEALYARTVLEPILLPRHSPALQLIQRARDEAHRFALAYHRRARTNRNLKSEIERIPGIGARRRKALLKKFGSVTKIRRASREELQPVIGGKLADVLIEYFAKLAAKRS